jgi:lycopene beta-cyclase
MGLAFWNRRARDDTPEAMARGKKSGLLIAGGGLAGSLAALALARLRPDVPVFLVGEEARFGGGCAWTFLDAELDEEERRLAGPFVSHVWPGYYAALPGRSRKIAAPCARIEPEGIDAAVRETLGESRYRLGAKIVAVRDDCVMLQGGEKIVAGGAIDAREANNLSMLDLGWRSLASRTYRFKAPHRVDRPVALDTTLGGPGLAACVPLDETRLVVEDCRYRRTSEIDPEAAARIGAYVKARGWKGGKVEAEETAVLPVALGGDFPAFWRFGGARVAKIGPRGGLFHPTSGSPLADAVRSALLLARQKDFSGGALHDLFESHAAAAWAGRDFYRSFNALLLRDGPAVTERLYGLDPALISRFHGERLGLLDRRRIMAAAAG